MENQTPQPDKPRPIETMRDGRLSCAIWANPGNEHGKNYSVTFSYSYKGRDEQWRETASIPGHEMLKAARLAENAYASVARLKDQDRALYVEQQKNATPSQAPEHPRER